MESKLNMFIQWDLVLGVAMFSERIWALSMRGLRRWGGRRWITTRRQQHQQLSAAAAASDGEDEYC